MRVYTRSKRISKAVDLVLRRMPRDDREAVVRFVSRVTAARAWTPVGVTGVDSTVARLERFWKAREGGVKCERRETGELHCERTGDKYEAQVSFNLPVVRLFSETALVGIVAHEFAHARVAARLGECWHEKMSVRGPAYERAADERATSWGFGKEIRLVQKERDKRVRGLLYSREREVKRARRAEIVKTVRRERLVLGQ
jgi:hypothetical protein